MIVEEQIENAPHRLRQQSMKCVSSGCRASILVAQVLCHAQRNFSSVYEKIVNSDGGNNTVYETIELYS